MNGIAFLSFQSVSPSNWSVLMKTEPLCSVVLKRMRSAGTRWPYSILMIIPTLMLLEVIGSIEQVPLG